MNKIRPYIFIVLLGFSAVLLGYNYFVRPFEIVDLTTLEENNISAPNGEEIQETHQEIFAKLNTKEKVLQMIAMPVVLEDGLEIPTSKNGFFTLFGNTISFELAKTTIINLKQENVSEGIVPFIAVDHEGGSVQRLSGVGFSKLDSWSDVCELTTSERDAVLKQSANQLKNAGIDVVLAPVLDIGENSVLKDRVCSEDSYAVIADRSMDFTTIFSKVGILPVLKHFPGIGQTKKDLHDEFEFLEVLENDVKLYKYVIDQNEKIGVMSSHVGVVSQDKDIPCSVSPYCVAELNIAYPDVLVFTDALDMKSVAYDIDNPKVPKDLTRVSKEAVLAGNNVLIYGPSVLKEDLDTVVNNLTQEYDNNEMFKIYVDNSVLKIIEYKYDKN